MASVETSTFKLQSLTTTNYFKWAIDVECALDMRDLWCAVKEDAEYAAIEDVAAREKKSRKAQSFLLIHISPKLRESVLDTRTAKELWDLLEQRYTQSSDDRNATLHLSLISAKQGAGEKMVEFISRLEGFSRELRERCNERVSDGMMVGVLMNGVLPKYAETIAALRCLDSLKLEPLKQKLLAAEDRLFVEGVRSSGKLVDQAQIEGRAFQTGGAGRKHQKEEHRRCFGCGQKGHIVRNCPNRKTTGAANTSHGGKDAAALMSGAVQIENKLVHTGASCAHVLLVDTGASHHVVCEKEFFVKMHQSTVQTVTCGGGEEHKVLGVGSVVVRGAHGMIRLMNTLYVPSFHVNLFSGSAACKNGATLPAQDAKLRVLLRCRTVLSAVAKDGLYQVIGRLLSVDDIPSDLFHATALMTSADVWHKRLGHVGFGVLKRMQRHRTANHFHVDDTVESCADPCPTCLAGKHERSPLPTSVSATSRCLQLVHADVIGKMPCESLGGSVYILTVLDDYSRYSAVTCVRHKSEVGSAFSNILALWARQTGQLVMRVRTDGGSEFFGDFSATLRTKGIAHERSVRYTPQQNGAAERLNRTLMERVRCLLINAGLPMEFWAEAASTANVLRNMVPPSGSKKSPREVFTGSKPDLGSLRVFGCIAYAQVPKKLRNKLESCIERGIFVGFEPSVKGWRLMIPGDGDRWHVVVSRDVKFVEHMPGFPALETSSNSTPVDIDGILSVLPDDEMPSAPAPATAADSDNAAGSSDATDGTGGDAGDDGAAGGDDATSGDTADDQAADETNEGSDAQSTIRRSARVRAAPDRFDPNAYANAAIRLSDEPQSLSEVMNRPDRELWEASMNEELTSLSAKQVYLWKELPHGRKALPSRWVFKLKRTQTGAVEKYKSRVVAKGLLQKQGVDYTEVFAPGSSLVTLRVLLSIAAKDDLEIHQLDVKTAFLNGDLAEEVYMTPPAGVMSVPGQVWLLWKALYGLKQAAQACALVLIKNPAAGAQNRTKHIDVIYNFSRHRVITGEISAHFVKNQSMLADIFTKQLPGPAFRMHCVTLGLAEKL